MISKWHHIDEPIRPKDLLKYLDVKNQKRKTQLDFSELNFGSSNIKADIYRDLIIFLASKGMDTGEVAQAIGIPRRTLVHQLRKIFKAPDDHASHE